jgi:glycine/D-amino acid oxidase-like deaminating enzyme
VAVIGGGITGLSAALALRRRGASVAVLEAHTIGWGASSRNGGMVLTGLKIDAATLISRYGLPLARELFKASVDSVDAVDRIVRSEQIDCQFTRRAVASIRRSTSQGLRAPRAQGARCCAPTRACSAWNGATPAGR